MSLKFFKQCGLIHSDLKPENIVFRLKSESRVKVIDFGSATYIYEKCQDYVQTRPYRAPEVIFGCDYDFSADMWSLGCILYEILTSKVLFSQKNLHEIICQVLSLEMSKEIYKMQNSPSDSTQEGNLFSGNTSGLDRKSSILSRESDELWSKTSSKVTNPKPDNSPGQSGINNETSVKSEQNLSGKTEIKKFYSKVGNPGKSQKSKDTKHNHKQRPVKADKDFQISQKVTQNLTKTLEKFEHGSRYKELISKSKKNKIK